MAKNSPARKARLQARHLATAAEERRLSKDLMAQGHSCSTCEHKGWRGPAELICELDSDFYGYVRVKPGHVCSRFKSAHQTEGGE